MASERDPSAPPAHVNPYAAPESVVGATTEPLVGETEAESIRRAHIGQEASVKGIGALMYLGAIFPIPLGLPGVGMGLLQGGSAESVVGVAFLGMGVLQFALGRGLRRLRPWARSCTAIYMSITLLLNVVQAALGQRQVVFGLLIGLYILVTMLGSKTVAIFRPEYREVIDRTPHIEYRTSIVVRVLVVILLLVLGLVILGVSMALVFGRR